MAQGATGMVSVIIPFLNEEKVLAEAIESVLQQTYRNWELILVDDGSTDQSSEIAKSYAASAPLQVRYFDHEGHRNKGLSFSRNLGMEKAKGDFIAFLDADDVWLKHKLAFQIKLFKMNPRAAMICEASEYWFHQWDDPTTENVVKQIGKQRDRLFEPPELLRQLYPLSDGCAPCPSGVIVRRDIALKHEGFETHFLGNYQLYEDQAFFHKIYLNEPVFISSLCNHRYRQRRNSIVQTIRREGNYYAVRLYFLDWLSAYVKQHHLQSRTMSRLMNRAMMPYRYPKYYYLKWRLLLMMRRVQKKLAL